MFRPSCSSSSPFSLTDLDMWDTKSRFTTQASAWCGMATVSGAGFLSNISTSTSGSTGGFRENNPGSRKWQSFSHLAPDGATRSFPPSLGAELRAARGECSFRQAEVGKWLQDAHEHLDTQLDRLKTRNSQLSYNITTAQLLDMKHKQLSDAMSALQQEKEAAELSQLEKGRQHRELHEKVLQLEKDLLQMRSALDRGSNDQPTERTPGWLSRTPPMSPDDFNRQERQKVDAELCRLKKALRDAEARAKTQEEERNQALQKLQTSTETQKMLMKQIKETNQSLSHTRQNYSEVQEQLSEANNKISQACLEKAILSTQVLKLEDDIGELKAKLRGALCDKDHLLQVNEKQTCEPEMIQQKLDTSQSQLQEITAERVINSEQITDQKGKCAQSIRKEEEVLSKRNEDRHEEQAEMEQKCCQLRESVEILELEKRKLQDKCLGLEAEVLEKEEMLHLQEEEYRKQDAVRVQASKELKAVASHWTEKWQKVALTLQSTQEELEDLKQNNFRKELHLASEVGKLKKESQKDKEKIENLLQHKAHMETVLTRVKRESDSLLRVELDACKQELELERSRSEALLHRCKDKGGEAVQTEDKETLTDLSQSTLLWEPPSDSHSSQNKPPQVSEEGQDDGGQANVSTTESLTALLEESRRRAKQLQQEKTLAVQKLLTLRQPHTVKDEKPSAEGRKDTTVCAVNLETDQQRRMVTEQLKSQFKEREGKEAAKADNRSAAAQTGASSLQHWTPTSKVTRHTGERRGWQQGSGLMPVFEEDEESSEEGPAEEAHPEENFHNQSQQMSTVGAEISYLKAVNENLLQATLRSKQPTQNSPSTAAEQTPDKSSDVELPNLSHCSDETGRQQKRPPSLYPDGTFLAELVDICSPDEDEEEGEDIHTPVITGCGTSQVCAL